MTSECSCRLLLPKPTGTSFLLLHILWNFSYTVLLLASWQQRRCNRCNCLCSAPKTPNPWRKVRARRNREPPRELRLQLLLTTPRRCRDEGGQARSQRLWRVGRKEEGSRGRAYRVQWNPHGLHFLSSLRCGMLGSILLLISNRIELSCVCYMQLMRATWRRGTPSAGTSPNRSSPRTGIHVGGIAM